MPKWKARCVNKRELLKTVVLHPELADAFKVNIEWLAEQRNKTDGLSIAGVEFYNDEDDR